MKKILLTLMCIISSALCVGVNAQTECSTIEEIKALASGTKCIYTGTATTTYYDGDNGVIMQDGTGAILIQHYNLAEANATRVKVGMEITNIVGTFKSEDASYMDRIKIDKAKDIENIEIVNEEATFSVQTVDFDDYVASLDQYEAKPVRLENVNMRPIEGTTNYEIYSLTTTNKLTVSFRNSLGMRVPSRADIEGFLSTDYSGKIFRVGSADVVTAYSYKTIYDIRTAVTEAIDKEFELIDTFTVTNVVNTNGGKILYIQDNVLLQNPANYAIRVSLPATSDVDDVKVGNRITGLFGKIIPYTTGVKQQSATFIQNATKSVKVVASIGKATVIGKYIYELQDNNMQNASMYDAGLISFSNGEVTKNTDGTYSYVVANENGQGRKSIALKMSGVEDLSAYVGKSCPIQGVLDIAATYPENQMTIIMRSDKDFLEPIIEFETIAELISLGAQVVEIEYRLVNPALVTYKFVKTQGTPIYFAIVQDNTAAIALCFAETAFDKISVGDSISGICGVYDARSKTNILNVDGEQRKSIEIENSGNTITGIKVSLKDIIENQSLYENRVVEVEGVLNDYTENGDVKLGYFVQGDYRLQYTTGDNSGDFIFYPYMSITAIVDNKLIGECFSLWPLSQEHIIDLGEVPTDVDDIKLNANIYSFDNSICIETEVGACIAVFNLSGQCLYAANSVDSTTMINNLTDGCVIVKVDNMVYKLMIK